MLGTQQRTGKEDPALAFHSTLSVICGKVEDGACPPPPILTRGGQERITYLKAETEGSTEDWTQKARRCATTRLLRPLPNPPDGLLFDMDKEESGDGRVHWTPVISCQLPSDVTSDMAGPKEDLLQPLGCGQDPPPALGPSSLMFPAAHDQSGCGKFKSFNSTTHWVPDLGLGFSGRKGTDIVRGPQDSVMASQVEVRSNMGPLSSSFFNDRVLQ
ncbi:hypothetical protein MG293_015269 [Ovis ammon polii]|uniref:Uncharacterized protein n=1 Tax=Ovis ammon polii TaxID=230172 RepID=A0AAD4TY72_OVIAM|nr:hypothetical protein MG293_015269 [Ovis ammon polii]